MSHINTERGRHVPSLSTPQALTLTVTNSSAQDYGAAIHEYNRLLNDQSAPQTVVNINEEPNTDSCPQIIDGEAPPPPYQINEQSPPPSYEVIHQMSVSTL